MVGLASSLGNCGNHNMNTSTIKHRLPLRTLVVSIRQPAPITGTDACQGVASPTFCAGAKGAMASLEVDAALLFWIWAAESLTLLTGLESNPPLGKYRVQNGKPQRYFNSSPVLRQEDAGFLYVIRQSTGHSVYAQHPRRKHRSSRLTSG